MHNCQSPYPVRSFKSKKDWEAYASWLRLHLKVCLGLLPTPARTPLRPKVFDKSEGDGFICEKVALESLPGFQVTGNLFRPAGKRLRRSRPAILCPHGHWPQGRFNQAETGDVPARCIKLAQMGALVFSYDMVGFGDSCQLPHAGFPEGVTWGLSLMGLQAWNSIRALDFMLTFPEVDPKRIGITGASGGGTQSFIMMAVDDRIAAAAPICMISYHMHGGCQCENAPALRLDASNVEIASLFAPKPLFIGSCTGDWTKDTPRKELPAIRSVYRLYGAANRVSGIHVDAPHNYGRQIRESVYGFMNYHLMGARSKKPVKEGPVRIAQLRDRMVWWGKNAPARMPARTIRKIWVRERRNAMVPHLATPAKARKHLGHLFQHVLGVLPFLQNGRPFVWNSKMDCSLYGNRLTVRLKPGRKPDLKAATHFLTYNHSELAENVNRILAHLEKVEKPVHLIGPASAGVPCLLAAAVSKRVKSLNVDMRDFDPNNDRHWETRVLLPGIRQIGGLALIFAMIGKRPLILNNATPALKRLARKYAR